MVLGRPIGMRARLAGSPFFFPYLGGFATVLTKRGRGYVNPCYMHPYPIRNDNFMRDMYGQF